MGSAVEAGVSRDTADPTRGQCKDCERVEAPAGLPACAGATLLVRAEALPEHGEAPAGLARGRSCGLKPLSMWKPLRAIFRFRHQDAQTPPSPRVGEGGRGDAEQPRGAAT